MIIHEVMILGGGTGTRSELNYLLSSPFFLMFFNGLSLYFYHTLLSLSFASFLNKGWVMYPKVEVAVDKGGGREYELLSS